MASKPKKIDTWSFESDGVSAAAPIYMHKGQSGCISFSGEIKEYEIRASNSDADKLRAELSTEFKRRVSVDWKPFLRVCFGGQTQSLVKPDNKEWFVQDVQAKLKLRVERLWIGTDSKGNKMYRDNHGDEGSYHSSVRSGMPDVGPVDTQWWSHGRTGGSDGTASLIADTPENLANIQRVIDGMEGLLERLRDMLAQDQIETTLALIGSNMLLLSAAPESAIGNGNQ